MGSFPPIPLPIRPARLRHRLIFRVSLDKSNPGTQLTTGRKDADLLTFTAGPPSQLAVAKERLALFLAHQKANLRLP